MTVTDEHEAYAVLAVQGPRSAEVLAALDLPTEHDYMSFAVASLDGAPLTVCRTGYTGEHGYELVVPSEQAAARSGTRWSRPASRTGCARPGWPPGTRCAPRWAIRCTARTCRLEISPVQAGSGWAVGWSKPEFWGRDALLAEKAAGPQPAAVGHRVARPGHPALPHGGAASATPSIGEVTSGTFSPTRRVGIGLALLDTAAGAAGDVVEVDVRGRRSRMRVVKPPFVRPSVR